MNKKFFIDFSGYCVVEAENEEKASEIFWDLVLNDKPLPLKVFEIYGIEEKEG